MQEENTESTNAVLEPITPVRKGFMQDGELQEFRGTVVDIDIDDFLQLLDNWQQLLRYELGQIRLQADLRQVLAWLRETGGYHCWWQSNCARHLPLQRDQETRGDFRRRLPRARMCR